MLPNRNPVQSVHVLSCPIVSCSIQSSHVSMNPFLLFVCSASQLIVCAGIFIPNPYPSVCPTVCDFVSVCPAVCIQFIVPIC